KDPTRVEASRPAMTADTITQYVVRIPSSDPKAKRTALRALVGREDVKNGIVFCNRKSEVDVVAKSLKTHGLDAAPIHGDLDQSLRMKTLAAFRAGELQLLVASDVAARGLDIPDVSHVFNYDVSHHADDYVHRIGRTGRAGRKGGTYMIVTPADDRALDKVLKLIKMSPEELTLDSAELGGGTSRRPEKTERPSRSRRPAAVAETAPEAGEAPVAEAPVDALPEEPAAASEAAPARRSRSRRGRSGRTPVEAAAEAVETPAAPTEVQAAAPEAPPRERATQEAHLRQSDRRGGRPADGAQRGDGRPFGEADIPAFLRRSSPIKV